ncbi:MAG TPA: DegT/DnrJ/EryC1/StrS family aminotransferase [Solirubrobacterales bacterium]|nr:DegT/DnrJ/EryC1/StrS family aminotransferase [Solirubrobacterales bacterium]
MNWQVPLCRPTFRDEDLEALLDAYRSGWLTMGPRTAELEQAFCEYTGVRHAVPVSSCSAALHLACLAAELGPGDEVIVPALTFTSTVSAITHVGATPRFADIAGPEQPWLSVASVEEAIGERTRAILTMAYGGHLGETAEIARLAGERGLILIEDAAHAAGSRLGGRHAGSFGLAGALSFSASKNLGIGEGGMLITSDSELATRVARQSWHGLGSQAWTRHQQAAPQYELGASGFNYRFDDPRAALLLSCLKRLDEDNGLRQTIDAAYREAFLELETLEPTAAPPSEEPSSYCLFTATLDPSIDRDAFRKSLAARGVQTSVHYPLLHKSGLHAQPGVQLANSEDYANRCVTLPLFPQMEQWQIELVTSAIWDLLGDPVRVRTAA